MKAKGIVESLVIATLVLAVFQAGGTVGAADDEATIGVLYAYTGDLGTYGEPETNAMKMAVKEVNENGGVLGKRLTLLIKDTKSSDHVAIAKAHELVGLKVPVIIGTAGSGPCMAIIDYTTSNGVLQISPSVTAAKFTDYPDNDLFFRTCPSDALQGTAMARLAIQQGYKTASTLVIWNTYGIGFEEAFTKKFELLGGKVLKSERYDPDTTTFNSEVEKVAAKNPDFVMLCAYPETGSGMLKAAYKKGYMDNIDWLLTEGLMSDDLADMVGKDDAGNYIISGLKGTAPDPRVVGPAYDDFKRNYTDLYGQEPIGYCANAYDAVALVALAMEKAGDVSSGTVIRDSLRDVANLPADIKTTNIGEALRIIREGHYSVNYLGASGDISFDKDGDVKGSYCEWSIADNGEVVLGNPIALEGPIVKATPTPKPTVAPTATPAPSPTATVTVTEEPEATPAATEEPTSTPTATPGFEVVFAIAGLLAVAYFVLRRKRA
ncbi:Chemotactic signal transduction system substrate-binding protein BasB [ANME-1 cluster archaeon GoMg2]|nr:Chemotactic signal transduction system substrate-binding protein BasB [ANME-1 cluster archaeon GoMg2]